MIHRINSSLATVVLVMACAGSVSQATADITVANVKDGETLRYPVALLRGTANSGNSLKVVNRDNVRPDGTNEVEVVRHRYVALVELVPGENRLTLTAGDESQRLSLHFRPMTTPYQLNVVYVTASDGDSRYITQRSDDRQNFRERLDTAAKLMQTFTAEALAEQGFGRKTFKLDLDEQGKVRVHVVRHPLSRDEIQADGFDLFGTLYGWIDGQFSMSVNKNMVIMAFTEKTPEGQLKAHTALGGGGMGLFGSGSLFSWPESLQDVSRTFADTTPIDASQVHDDSVDRSVVWGLASTTIGAALHEMGHTFDLPHSPDPFCIMSRGFDFFNRRFCVVEPPSKFVQQSYPFRDNEIAHFSPFFAAQLAHHRWFQPDAVDTAEGPTPRIRLDRSKSEFVFEAPLSLAFIGAAGPDQGQTFWRELTNDRTKSFRVPCESLWSKCGGRGNFEIVLIDHQGNRVAQRDGEFRDPDNYLHSWRIQAEPTPWSNLPDSPLLSDKERATLTASLRRAKLFSYAHDGVSPFWSLDFNQAYGERGRCVAYALTTLTAKSDRAIRLLAGADDGLRVWLNDQLVIDRPGLQVIGVDDLAADVTLKPGENTLLVEVTQGGGGWGFSLRCEPPLDPSP